MFYVIVNLVFAHKAPNRKVSLLKPFPGSDHKMVMCSFPFRDKSSLQCVLKILSLTLCRRVGANSLRF